MSRDLRGRLHLFWQFTLILAVILFAILLFFLLAKAGK